MVTARFRESRSLVKMASALISLIDCHGLFWNCDGCQGKLLLGVEIQLQKPDRTVCDYAGGAFLIIDEDALLPFSFMCFSIW